MTVTLLEGSIVSLVSSLIIGLLIGIIVKKAIQVGIILLILIVLLYAVGIIQPSTINNLISDIGIYGERAYRYASDIKSILPYTSLSFIIGFLIGLWKG